MPDAMQPYRGRIYIYAYRNYFMFERGGIGLPKMLDVILVHEQKLVSIIREQGTSAARGWVYHNCRIKISGAEMRDILGIKKNPNHKLALDVKKLAWQICGYPGSGRINSLK